MKKNLMFLTLLISVLMISVVSAGITGYLTRGGTLNTDGYKATLQKVDSSGVASISVQTPSGATEVVRVGKDETAQVGDAEISASSLREGSLFRRAGAEISVKTDTEEVLGASKGLSMCATCYNQIFPNYNGKELFALKNGQSVMLGSINSINFYEKFVEIRYTGASPTGPSADNTLLVPNEKASIYSSTNEVWLLEEIYLKIAS